MFPENTVEQYMEHCFSGRFLRKPPRATGRLKGKQRSYCFPGSEGFKQKFVFRHFFKAVSSIRHLWHRP